MDKITPVDIERTTGPTMMPLENTFYITNTRPEKEDSFRVWDQDNSPNPRSPISSKERKNRNRKRKAGRQSRRNND